MNLNNYADKVHEANKKWWICTKCESDGGMFFYLFGTGNPDVETSKIICPFCNGTKKAKRNMGELIALVHSELSEALEGDRKSLSDDKLPRYEMLDVELIDVLIRVFDILGSRGVDVEQIYQDKMNYNANRADHKLENRMKEGGKKY